MAHYLVTGVAGFIASRVAGMLLDEGHEVTGLDNLNDAYDVRMKEYRLAILRRRAGFRFHHLDISSRSQVETLVDDQPAPFAAVINLAARAGVRQSVENPWVYVETNVTGTLNLLELCHRLEVPKFILASTSSIYGDNAPLPTPETWDSDHPLQAYAASKKGAEALCHAYHHLYGVDVSVLRFFTVYGPAGRPDMVMFRFAQWIAEGRPVLINGSGEQTRGFTYVDDIARGVILGLKPLGYQVINLGGHQTISINELLRMFEEQLGQKALIRHLPKNSADMQANWADVTRAGELLGWEAQVTLSEGVKNLVDWYLAERSWASQIVTA
jgi:nucleoside-diphosphate-sugar epimerase